MHYDAHAQHLYSCLALTPCCWQHKQHQEQQQQQQQRSLLRLWLMPWQLLRQIVQQ